MDNIKQIYVELANLAKRKHYFCEDRWYSCPKAEGGCANDAEGDECTCGADAHNAKVNELLAAALAKPEPEGPTDDELNEPLGDLIDKWCQEGMRVKPHGTSFPLAHYVASKAYQYGLRKGRPAPVPVSERLPGAEDCDAEGMCWWYCAPAERWLRCGIPEPNPASQVHTHWLPAHALPQPS